MSYLFRNLVHTIYICIYIIYSREIWNNLGHDIILQADSFENKRIASVSERSSHNEDFKLRICSSSRGAYLCWETILNKYILHRK